MMKSLHDIDHLSALFMKDSSIRTQNKAAVPVEGFGTRDNLSLLQVWILSLGIQKEVSLQLLGRNELQRFKTLQPAIKYIRYRLMDVRNQSEVKHDLDSKLTPMMISVLASPSRDSKQTSFLAINTPHLLRFAQTGINQQDTSQQSPLLLHSTPIRTIHIKMTRIIIAPLSVNENISKASMTAVG